jgi:hypothetical protein
MNQKKKHQTEKHTEQRTQQLAVNPDFARGGRDMNPGGLGDWALTLGIVLLARRFIMEHLIRFVQGFHFFFAAAAVRMTQVGQPLIEKFDLAVRSIFACAEYLVIILTRV